MELIERNKEILLLREKHTLQEIWDIYWISGERVRQICGPKEQNDKYNILKSKSKVELLDMWMKEKDFYERIILFWLIRNRKHEN